MATYAAPNGLKPVAYIGGRSYAGAMHEYPIASGYDVDIGQGDVVRVGGASDTTNEGYLMKETGTSTVTKPVGVFLGCSYTDPNSKQIVHANHFPADLVASDIKAKVIDDPMVVYRVQASGAVTQPDLGENCALVQGAVNTTTGYSTVSANASTATTAALPLRIVGFVEGPDSAVGDAYTDLLVTINFGQHALFVATAR